MKVSDILKTKKRAGEILCVNADDKIGDAVRKMVENDTGSVVVFGEGKQFMGMLTFREVLVALHNDGYETGKRKACSSVVDKEHMSYAEPENSIDEVRNTMINGHIRYLPIIQDGELTDVVSFYDVARSIVKAANYENKMLKEYIRNWPEQEDSTNE